MTAIAVDIKNRIALVALNRPERLNALSFELIDQLMLALQGIESDDAVRAVILTGAGDRAFSAGADIHEFSTRVPLGTEVAVREFVRRGQTMTARLEAFPKPVIAAVNGLAFGGGCEVTEAVHLAIASERATFAKPEIKLGMPPTFGGTQRLHGMIPAKVLARFAGDVERDIGITVSIGLSVNKFLAKIASDLDKPRGFAVLDREDAVAMLAPKPVGFIFGVGPATEARLAQRGFRLIGDLQRADETELMRQFGDEGRRLWRLSRGVDDRRVIADRDAKTISSETTFETDIKDLATLEKMLWRLCEKVSARLKSGEIAGSTITLKLKTADFRQRTRSQTINAPTQLAGRIFGVVRDLLAREIDGTSFRLIGAGVSALRPAAEASDDTDLIDRRSAHAERAMDDLRKKFGDGAVIRGIAFRGPGARE